MGTIPQTGVICVSMVARHHGLDVSVDKLNHDFAVGEQPAGASDLVRMATSAGLKARATTLDWEGLVKLRRAFPVMVQLRNENWVIATGPVEADGAPDGAVAVVDPLANNQQLVVTRQQLCDRWDGKALLIQRRYALTDADRPFGLLWFMAEIVRQRGVFRDVAIASIALLLLGLVTPLFFQILVDKVLVHEGYATLYVLAIGIVVALIFESLFTFLRRYLLLYATNKVDVRTGMRTFAHLLALPLGYFEQRQAGVVVRHLQQTERIREFLTGRLFLTMLDALSLAIFVPILLMYSVKLTLVVIGFALLVAGMVAGLVGTYRRRLKALYEAEAERQALVVETVHGMHTVKSLAMEPVQRRLWEERLARAVTLRFGVEKISAFAQAAVGLTEKLMSVTIICLGTLDVFAGTLTVGSLIAFNMLAGRVSSPLVQIANMIHEYQEVALSVSMLGEVMNHRTEQKAGAGGLSPALKGQIEFDNISFRYAGDGPAALNNVSFTVPEGTVFGIVGRSGSGKTTVTRLIHGLHDVQQGLVRIDGNDIREIDLAHLRRSIGVVLQENFLFRGTVRDNICVTSPGASLERIVAAARLAGADEFIERLPKGFNTMIEENGANLSGGQRQRIAIARALLTDPRILVFDEATSALDPESEAVIRANLKRIAEGRTVIIVSHRLSSLVAANAILVLDRGQVVDLARHDQLLSRCATYRQLWNQQNRQSA